MPDTGSLRGDVTNLLRQANSQRGHLAVTVITRLGGFYWRASEARSVFLIS